MEGRPYFQRNVFMQPTLVILAAGLGSRYGGLKQLEGVGPNGEPILEYCVFDAIRAGFGKLVFVIRPDFADPFKAMVTRTFGARIPVEYVFQELHRLPVGFAVPAERQKPWGTGHAILCSEPVVSEPFAAINADDFYGATAFQVMADYLRTARDDDRANYAMVGYELAKTLSPHGSVSRGICRLEGPYLQSVVELTKIETDGSRAKYTDENGQTQPLRGDEWVSMNIWGFTPSIFGHLQRLFVEFLEAKGQELKSEFYIPTVIDTLVRRDLARVRVLASRDAWFGITYQEDKPVVVAAVQQLIAEGKYPSSLWA
jgi:UTP-glucose-1-phosphate uridylyltransferase